MKQIISQQFIQERIAEMASDIDAYYMKQDWYKRTDEPIIAIGVLSGSLFFMVDLLRQLSIRVKLDFVRMSTYPGKSIVAQKPKITSRPEMPLHDAHILIIDDILDTGKTLGVLKEELYWNYPKSIRTAVLLRKPGKTKKDIAADFIGFDIPDKFVVGMGMDYDGKYRGLPYIATLGTDFSLEKEDECRTSKIKAERY